MHPNDVVRRESIITLASYGAGLGLMLIGAAAKGVPTMRGGASSTVGPAAAPNPVSPMVERTDVSWLPAVYNVSPNMSGITGGFSVHKDWRATPLFTEVRLASPLLVPGNGDNYRLNTNVAADLGLAWKTTWTRMLAGVETLGVFGGGENTSAGIGGVVGLDLKIPFNGKEDGAGMVLGVRASGDKLFPEGWQCELAPAVGVTIPHP
jgi:hypothetical protein